MRQTNGPQGLVKTSTDGSRSTLQMQTQTPVAYFVGDCYWQIRSHGEPIR